MSHRLPGGELAPVFEAALDLLQEKLVKKRFGAGAVANGKTRPKKARRRAARPAESRPPGLPDPAPRGAGQHASL